MEEKFSVNFPENSSKQEKSIVYLYVTDFGEKNNFYLYLSSLIKTVF